MNKKLRSLLLLLWLPLAGCGIVAIGYSYAEAYLGYSINSYASFNDEQKVSIKNEVHDFMRWHRKNMLPEYVRYLQALQAEAESGALLTTEQAASFRTRLRALYVSTLQPTVKPAASLLSGVTPAQIEELAESFARENNKQKKKDLSGSQTEQLRKRAERSIDFMETFVGNLSDKQLEKIRQTSYQLPYASAIYIAQREDNQAALLELLKNKKRAEDIAVFLSAWLSAPEAGRSDEEQGTLRAFESASDEMIAGAYNMLTDRQRKTLLKNIVKYIDTFQELARAS